MYRSRHCRCCRTIGLTAKSVRSPRGTVGATQSHARLEHQRERGMGARPRAYRTSSPDGMGSSFGARTSAKTKGGGREYGFPKSCSEGIANPTRSAWAFCCRAIPVGEALRGVKIIEADPSRGRGVARGWEGVVRCDDSQGPRFASFSLRSTTARTTQEVENLNPACMQAKYTLFVCVPAPPVFLNRMGRLRNRVTAINYRVVEAKFSTVFLQYYVATLTATGRTNLLTRALRRVTTMCARLAKGCNHRQFHNR
jgi:hypothetical protein